MSFLEGQSLKNVVSDFFCVGKISCQIIDFLWIKKGFEKTKYPLNTIILNNCSKLFYLKSEFQYTPENKLGDVNKIPKDTVLLTKQIKNSWNIFE